MGKLLLLGGTFNPIHNGHLSLAEHFLKRTQADRVLLIPTKVPVHKSGEQVVSAFHRINMCRLACESLDRFEVSEIETAREGKSYTADTLLQLHLLRPADELFFVMGSDMFFTLPSWYEPRRIFELATICVAARKEGEYRTLCKKAEEYRLLGARCVVENFDVVDISSSELRCALEHGRDVSAYLPVGVEQYIKTNGLYQNAKDS